MYKNSSSDILPPHSESLKEKSDLTNFTSNLNLNIFPKKQQSILKDNQSKTYFFDGEKVI
jgi:hypothetical protein